MIDVIPGTIISVKTSKDVYKCRSLVLALGPWAAKFLPRLGLELPLQVKNNTLIGLISIPADSH